MARKLLSGAQVSGPFLVSLKTVTANYTVSAATDYAVFADTTSGAITLTLPDATTCAGQQFALKNLDGSNAVTVNTVLGQLIDGALTTLSISTGYTGTTLISDGSNWHTFGSTGWFNQAAVSTLSVGAASIYGGLNMEGSAVTGVDGLTVSAGVAALDGGTDTSSAASVTNPSLTSGTAAQLSTTHDMTFYILVNTTSTVALTFGSTSAAATTLVGSGSRTAPFTLGGYRIPKGWYVKATFTSADVTLIAVPC